MIGDGVFRVSVGLEDPAPGSSMSLPPFLTSFRSDGRHCIDVA